ncbi:hypothetical protein B0T25DRAFT_569103 [Lasiosphaeria hispida]|uniref:Uncharacterized protein n=1 Tax=Lasiosphaeria hispida TaxID=260671 RepID=A0AAJ0HK93_9PEZI|nr:hypothetical protein B0T25DRAFT_569103 [Lasiosphaeria hispida]
MSRRPSNNKSSAARYFPQDFADEDTDSPQGGNSGGDGVGNISAFNNLNLGNNPPLSNRAQGPASGNWRSDKPIHAPGPSGAAGAQGTNNPTRNGNARATLGRTGHGVGGASWRTPVTVEGQQLLNKASNPPRPQIRFLPGIHLVRGNGITPLDPNTRTVATQRRSVGSGTAADPILIWVGKSLSDAEIGNPCKLSFIEKLCRAEAMRTGFKCMVIRSPPHKGKRLRSEDGTQMMVAMNNGNVNRAHQGSDLHLTVYMGENFSRCQVQGHIFLVQMNENDVFNVVKMARPQQRKLLEPGEMASTEEYWCVNGVVPVAKNPPPTSRPR